MNDKELGLKREIGTWGLSANIINIIVGSGIFVLPAIVAEGLGSASVVAYLFCGLLICLVMLCFAEIGSKVTVAGGAYAYVEAAFGDYAGFVTSVFFIFTCMTADAAVANALADVLGSVIPFFKIGLVRIAFFLILFAGLAYVNVKGVKGGIGLVKFNTVAKLLPLILLGIIGWKNVDISNLAWTSFPNIGKVGEVSLILFFAFQGAECGLSVSGEVSNPKKTIPKAIFISISIVLILYILIQFVAQGVLGTNLTGEMKSPLSEVAKIVFGPIGFTLMTLGAIISMFGYLSGEILSIPRVAYGAARDGVIPIKALARIHKSYATPFMAVIIYAGLDFFVASVGGFKILAILAGSAMLLVYLAVVAAVIKFRSKEVKNENVFTIPGGLAVPILSCIAMFWLLSHMPYTEMVGIASFILILTVIYFALQYFKKGNSLN